MKVLGFTVTPEIESACLDRMMSNWFTAGDIANVAWRFHVLNRGPSYDTSYRIADRIIQRERKAGNLVRRGTGWTRKS